jgi:dihydrofolate synthase/folylpolyglutamate synthase
MPRSASTGVAAISTAAGAIRAAAAHDFLLGRVNYEHALTTPGGRGAWKLARMEELLARLGRPDRHLPIVHVAGTKGKGSTAAMIAAMLTAAGYRTGLFTSPHLHRVEERLRIDGAPCPEEEFVALIEHIRPAVEELDRQADARGQPADQPTYFELLTALAMVWFARQKVDMAVLEVGLGGRLDATNVCQPRLAVITSISFDHTDLLGNDLTAIAREKAGIIKPAVPVVSGAVEVEPRAVIRETCARLGCRLVELGRDFSVRYQPPQHLEQTENCGFLDFRYHAPPRDRSLEAVPLRLPGSHQAANAAVAMAAVMELEADGWPVPEPAIRSALATLAWPARIEVIARHPTVILDGAHNVASIEALLETLKASFHAARRHLIFGAARDKDVRGMLTRLLENFDSVVFTTARNNPRAVPCRELAALAHELSGRDFPTAADPPTAWEMLQPMLGPADLLCITGSFYLAAELHPAIAGERRAR